MHGSLFYKRNKRDIIVKHPYNYLKNHLNCMKPHRNDEQSSYHEYVLSTKALYKGEIRHMAFKKHRGIHNKSFFLQTIAAGVNIAGLLYAPSGYNTRHQSTCSKFTFEGQKKNHTTRTKYQSSMLLPCFANSDLSKTILQCF